jgi:predicted phosphodiesterase
LSADLDPSTTLELIGQTDARLVCVGFTHQARVKDYGWKVLVDAGSAGLPYDGEASAAFAVIDIDPEAATISAEVHRATYDTEAVSDAITARGLAGDAYRAATVRTGKMVR